MDALILPLDQRAIQQILPHRYPFLLVDRITELEPDKRIVGIKNVSISERFLSPSTGAKPGVLSSWMMRTFVGSWLRAGRSATQRGAHYAQP